MILNLLAQISEDQAMNPKAMDMYKSDKEKFKEAAKAETLKHAK